MGQPFLGMLAIFGFNFAPVGWAFCQGQLLPISENDALYALLGTTYGGDGQTTFGLPDLRGRLPVGMGQGPGLSNYSIGQAAGQENVTLSQAQLPSHTHPLRASSVAGNQSSPEGNVLGNTGNIDKEYSDTIPDITMLASSIVATGQSTPSSISIRQPTLALNICISLFGIFPSRN